MQHAFARNIQNNALYHTDTISQKKTQMLPTHKNSFVATFDQRVNNGITFLFFLHQWVIVQHSNSKLGIELIEWYKWCQIGGNEITTNLF